MTFVLRKAAERGRTHTDWLDSRHSFSFGDYHDPAHMGYRSLRVINDDRVAGGGGFPQHGHRDMEIVTVMLEGALQHRDSLGNGSVIQTGDIQRMSAGKGILHSEFNASETEPAHFLQIWLLPSQRGTAPSYDQRPISPELTEGRFGLVAAPAGEAAAISIAAPARLSMAKLAAGATASFTLPRGRFGWLHVATGSVSIGNHALTEGDALAWANDESISVQSKTLSTILLFDLE